MVKLSTFADKTNITQGDYAWRPVAVIEENTEKVEEKLDLKKEEE